MGLKTQIADFLDTQQGPNFSACNVRIRGGDYQSIARSVRSAQTQVVLSPATASTCAAYNRQYNCFLVGATPSNSVLVHEATHAIQDLHRRAIVDVDDEACAYIAQFLYTVRSNADVDRAAGTPRFVHNTSTLNRVCTTTTTPGACNAAAMGYAAQIAREINLGHPIPAELLAHLREVLARDPATHQDATTNQRRYNGLGRVAIPAEYLAQFNGTIVND